MKLLIAGDTHGDLQHLRYLLQTAQRNGCPKLFVVGDFGYWEHMRDGVEFLDHLSLSSIKNDVPVYFLDGNHDNRDYLLAQGYPQDDEGFTVIRTNVLYADRGHTWTWGATTFLAAGGAYSVDKEYRLELEKGRPERYWFSGEEMTDDELNKILERTEPVTVDVVLSHDKPRMSAPGWNRKTFQECLPNQISIQSIVERYLPHHLFHGHLHYSYEDVLYLDATTKVLVRGLDCNADSADSPRYEKRNSYTIYDCGGGPDADSGSGQ